MCSDLIRQLNGTGNNNLARYFVDAITANRDFCQIERPFIPANRANNHGRNRVTQVMQAAGEVRVTMAAPAPLYTFTYHNREVPHLRAANEAEQLGRAWIDYVARVGDRPILGEIKWKQDKNPFYAFVQLLTYFSEIATPNQMTRSIRHALFGNGIPAKPVFDLHIFLANFDVDLSGLLW